MDVPALGLSWGQARASDALFTAGALHVKTKTPQKVEIYLSGQETNVFLIAGWTDACRSVATTVVVWRPHWC